MHQQARHPEIFDQILQNTPLFWDLVPEHPPMKFFPESKSDLTQNTPPENEIFPRVQVRPYPEYPPNNWKL